MRTLVECHRSRARSRLAFVALLMSGVAGCSGEASRFGDNPSASPYNGQMSGQPAPQVSRVDSQPLPPPQSGPTPPNSMSYGYPPPPPPPAQARPDLTGSISPDAQKPRNASASSTWNWDGGTAITVKQGDTIESLSRKYGVPASAIMQALSLIHI